MDSQNRSEEGAVTTCIRLPASPSPSETSPLLPLRVSRHLHAAPQAAQPPPGRYLDITPPPKKPFPISAACSPNRYIYLHALTYFIAEDTVSLEIE